MREWNQLEAAMRMSDVNESPEFFVIVETFWICIAYFEVDKMKLIQNKTTNRFPNFRLNWIELKKSSRLDGYQIAPSRFLISSIIFHVTTKMKSYCSLAWMWKLWYCETIHRSVCILIDTLAERWNANKQYEGIKSVSFFILEYKSISYQPLNRWMSVSQVVRLGCIHYRRMVCLKSHSYDQLMVNRHCISLVTIPCAKGTSTTNQHLISKEIGMNETKRVMLYLLCEADRRIISQWITIITFWCISFGRIVFSFVCQF